MLLPPRHGRCDLSGILLWWWMSTVGTCDSIKPPRLLIYGLKQSFIDVNEDINADSVERLSVQCCREDTCKEKHSDVSMADAHTRAECEHPSVSPQPIHRWASSKGSPLSRTWGEREDAVCCIMCCYHPQLPGAVREAADIDRFDVIGHCHSWCLSLGCRYFVMCRILSFICLHVLIFNPTLEQIILQHTGTHRWLWCVHLLLGDLWRGESGAKSWEVSVA